MPFLILLRHGQSQWNLENRFTGWIDVPLSPLGEEEARRAGESLKNIPIDVVFTSVLKRAIDTTTLSLEAAGKSALPVQQNVALNERHYGDLQGLNKAETAEKYGAEQVHIWRRSFDVRPPGETGESLQMTIARVLPYYEEHILPELRAGKNVLVVAHGNSLRALLFELEHHTKESIMELNIPTGVPLVYELEFSGTEPRILSKRALIDQQ